MQTYLALKMTRMKCGLRRAADICTSMTSEESISHRTKHHRICPKNSYPMDEQQIVASTASCRMRSMVKELVTMDEYYWKRLTSCQFPVNPLPCKACIISRRRPIISSRSKTRLTLAVSCNGSSGNSDTKHTSTHGHECPRRLCSNTTRIRNQSC